MSPSVPRTRTRAESARERRFAVAAVSVLGVLACTLGIATLLGPSADDTRLDETPRDAAAVVATSADNPEAGVLVPGAQLAAATSIDPLPRPVLDTADLTDASALHLSIRHADGRPAAYSTVAVGFEARGADMVGGVTDAQGDVTLDGRIGRAQLHVGGALPLSFRTLLPSARGRHVVTLPRGARLAGRVLIDGRPPVKPVPIGLTYTIEGRDDMLGDGPRAEALLTAMTPGVAGAVRPNGRWTGPEGRFEFTVPNPPYVGSVRVEGSWERITSPAGSGPDDDLTIELRTVPVVRGRVAGQGAPGATVHFLKQALFGPEVFSFVVDEHGGFELPASWLPPGARSLRIVSADGEWMRCVRFDVDDAAFGCALGEIRLVRTRRILCTVLDNFGTPVSRAAISAPGTSLLDAALTSPRGRVRLDWPSDETLLAVRASGHVTALVSIGAAAVSGEVEVGLRRASTLDVLVTRADAGSLHRFRAVLRHDSGPEPAQQAAFGRTDTGEARFEALAPGRSVVVEVLDPSGTPCWSSGPTELMDGEWRRFVITLRDALFTQEFVVRDERGTARPAATVEVCAPGLPSGNRSWGTNHRIFVDTLRTGRYDLRASASGLAPKLVSDVWIDGSDDVIEIRLEPLDASASGTTAP